MPGISTVKKESASISLVTSSYDDSAHYHLMELTPDMVHYFEAEDIHKMNSAKRRRSQGEEGDSDDGHSSSSNSRLCIKGRHSDEAVLCTPTQTFTLREMTQSNSLLLCTLKQPKSKEEDCEIRVRSNVAQIWELTPVVARTGRIAQLLGDSLYQGEEEEKHSCSKKYTPQQVASIVQASPKELQEGLHKNHVILIDGSYRMISPDYLMESLQVLLNHVDLHAYPLERVPFLATVSSLEKDHNMRREMTEAILRIWFGKTRQEKGPSNGKDKLEEPSAVEIDVVAMVRFIGLQLLVKKAKQAPTLLDDFQREWKDVVGVNLSDHTNLELLEGHYLTFPAPPTQPSDSHPITIQHFASSDLPLEPATRLQHLFKKREMWTLQELSPFLDEIAVDAKKRDGILLKYARTTVAKIPILETKADRKARLRRGVAHGPTKNLQLYSARLRQA
ncbi:hypothetical protein CBS101457_004174 [Exobasidium rhododendri]|nr:hypothetical protein CBS101457_004174 [Exobasidium rhododendri]